METIVKPILGQLKITLPKELECALNCGHNIQIYTLLREFAKAIYSMTATFDRNMEKLETFAGQLADFGDSQIRIFRSINTKGEYIWLLKSGSDLFELKPYEDKIVTWRDLVIEVYAGKLETLGNAGMTISVAPSYSMTEITTANGATSTKPGSKPEGASIRYAVDKPGIATVDANGTLRWLTANDTGSERSVTVTVTVEVNGEMQQQTVTVYQKPMSHETVFTAYAWKQSGIPSELNIRQVSKELSASSETISVTSEISDGVNCLCVAVPVGGGYRVTGIVDQDGDNVMDACQTIEIGSYTIYYNYTSYGLKAETMTVKLSK